MEMMYPNCYVGWTQMMQLATLDCEEVWLEEERLASQIFPVILSSENAEYHQKFPLIVREHKKKKFA